MKVEFINSQRMRISDQGIILEVIGDVAELQDIANSINIKGVFHLPKGTLALRQDFICIDHSRICIESDPHTLNRIMELGSKNFQLPMPREDHIETPGAPMDQGSPFTGIPTTNRGYDHYNDLPLPAFLEPLVPHENHEVEFVENSHMEELPLLTPSLHNMTVNGPRRVPTVKNRVATKSYGEKPLLMPGQDT
jgi:hypothetical protein